MEPASVHPAFTRPSLIALLSLIVGQLLADALNLAAWQPALSLAAIGMAAMLLRPVKSLSFVIAFCVLFIAFGAAQRSWVIAGEMDSYRGIRHLVGESVPLAQVTGRVAAFPTRTQRSWTVMLAEGALLETRGSHGNISAPIAVRLAVDPTEDELLARVVPGDALAAVGSLTLLAGEGDGDEWLRSKGAVAILRARRLQTESSSSQGPMASFLRFARICGNAAEKRFSTCLSPEHAAILTAMTLGRTHGLSDEQRLVFRRTGLMHLFAVSGLHTVLVGGTLLMLLRIFGLPALVRVLLLALLLFFFAALVGMRASVLRAAILLLVFDARELLRRPVEPLAALASVALLLLVQSPRALWQVDFQMTFLCVATMIFLSPWLNGLQVAIGRRFGWTWKSALLIGAAKLTCISAAIQLVLMPVLIGSFGEVSLIAPLANVLLLAIAAKTIVVGFAFLVIDLALPGIGYLMLSALAAPLWLLQRTAEILASLPLAAWQGVPLPLVVVALLYLILLAGAWSIHWPQSWPRRTAWNFAPAALALGISLALIPVRLLEGERLDVWFLDVGQGDATLLRTADGRAALIDAGPEMAAWQLPELLRQRGIRELEFIVATHADGDHIGGIPHLLRTMTVKHLYVNGGWNETRGFEDLQEVVAEQHLPVTTLRRGAMLILATGVALEVLHPSDEFVRGSAERNDSSLALMLRYGGHTLLLPGDAEQSAEEHMVRSNIDLRADILKAGHHGAGTSTTPAFIEAVSPRFVVISCGRNNRYGHPALLLMQRLQERGLAIYRTDGQGSIQLELHPGHNPRWRTARSESAALK